MQLPPAFDRTVALECADLVVQAYAQFDRFKQGMHWDLQGNYDTPDLLAAKPEGPLAREEPFGFVARSRASGNVFVTFRGTHSPDDWLSNFDLPQVPHPWGQAQQGFSNLYAQCSADVRASVQGAGAVPNVFVTGHSLGAALATLAAADLVHSEVAPGAALYSFAGPRVGDPAFAAQFNRRVTQRWRIVNTEDIVTKVPLSTPAPYLDESPDRVLGIIRGMAHKLDYEHVGIPLGFTTHNGSILANHAMQVYIDALKAS